MKINTFTIALTGLLITGVYNQSVSAQNGATLFKSCAACHSIGGGRMIGPDLKGITRRRTNDWLVSFIQSSSKLISSGDTDAKAIFKAYNNIPMPDNALTADQINLILSHIDGGKAGLAAIDPKLAAMQHKIDSLLKTNSQQDIHAGYELFNGTRRFQNRGASCASCHNATYNDIGRGGILAKDLSKAYSRLGGFAGIKGIIASPPFPSMMKTYKNSPVTDEENAYLQLFLKDADVQNPEQVFVEKSWFLHLALLLAFLITLAITLLWFKRKHRSVNDSIIKRQVRYSK